MINDPEWLQIVPCIVSWLYSTVAKEIWTDFYKAPNSAYTAWTAMTGQFLDNNLQRAVYAQLELRSLFYGDMSIMATASTVPLTRRLHTPPAVLTDRHVALEEAVKLLLGVHRTLDAVVEELAGDRCLGGEAELRGL